MRVIAQRDGLAGIRNADRWNGLQIQQLHIGCGVVDLNVGELVVKTSHAQFDRMAFVFARDNHQCFNVGDGGAFKCGRAGRQVEPEHIVATSAVNDVFFVVGGAGTDDHVVTCCLFQRAGCVRARGQQQSAGGCVIDSRCGGHSHFNAAAVESHGEALFTFGVFIRGQDQVQRGATVTTHSDAARCRTAFEIGSIKATDHIGEYGAGCDVLRCHGAADSATLIHVGSVACSRVSGCWRVTSTTTATSHGQAGAGHSQRDGGEASSHRSDSTHLGRRHHGGHLSRCDSRRGGSTGSSGCRCQLGQNDVGLRFGRDLRVRQLFRVADDFFLQVFRQSGLGRNRVGGRSARLKC